MGVTDPTRDAAGIFGLPDNTSDLELHTVRDRLLQKFVIIAPVGPDAVPVLVLIQLAGRNDCKGLANPFIIREGQILGMEILRLFRVHHLRDLIQRLDAQRIQGIVADLVVGADDQHRFVITLRPCTGQQLTGSVPQSLILPQLGKDVIAVGIGRHQRVDAEQLGHAHLPDHQAGVDLLDAAILQRGIHHRGDTIGIGDLVGILQNGLFIFGQVLFEGCQVVGLYLRLQQLGHIPHHIAGIDLVKIMFL